MRRLLSMLMIGIMSGNFGCSQIKPAPSQDAVNRKYEKLQKDTEKTRVNPGNAEFEKTRERVWDTTPEGQPPTSPPATERPPVPDPECPDDQSLGSDLSADEFAPTQNADGSWRLRVRVNSALVNSAVSGTSLAPSSASDEPWSISTPVSFSFRIPAGMMFEVASLSGEGGGAATSACMASVPGSSDLAVTISGPLGAVALRLIDQGIRFAAYEDPAGSGIRVGFRYDEELGRILVMALMPNSTPGAHRRWIEFGRGILDPPDLNPVGE